MISRARAVRHVFSRLHTPQIPPYLGGVGAISQERVEARRVRPDQRSVESVGVGGGQPESGAIDGRSMPVD
jgi:hypothetical protein